jgi:adenosylcobinamide-phosphate synthase
LTSRTAIALAFAGDRVLGDPPRLHPVAGFGAAASALERLVWRPRRTAGAAYASVLVAAVAVGVAAAVRRRPLVGATVVWAALGGRSLERAAMTLAAALEAGDIDEARRLAPVLVGRDPSELSAAELCRAAVESVAENANDAVVAPLFWAAVAGAPGAGVYRAINTLDAMVGHKHDRYREFGWFSARLDDYASWPSARVTALLAIVCAPLVGGLPRAAWRAAWRDGRAHPSPNAGRVEGAFAGALGVRLGGVNRYGHGVELRPHLGDGRVPAVADIARAVALARLVGAGALLLALAAARR